ncbi:DUF1764-domain-containing protein [Atractiella rhizophila]|nr:DUF1764-domain-containing protein [Atractiella rhizophila]
MKAPASNGKKVEKGVKTEKKARTAEEDIDAIFSTKSSKSSKRTASTPSSTSIPSKETEKKKRKSSPAPDEPAKKRKKQFAAPTSARTTASKVPEVLQDPSLALSTVTQKAKPKGEDIDPEVNRRRTEDGLKIYAIEELGIGKGGDTDQCPFDCDCCF